MQIQILKRIYIYPTKFSGRGAEIVELGRQSNFSIYMSEDGEDKQAGWLADVSGSDFGKAMERAAKYSMKYGAPIANTMPSCLEGL